MKHFMIAAILISLFYRPGMGLAAPTKAGFLVVAPDRGFLGNQEVEVIFDEFRKSYPSALALVGRDYNGLESEYSVYLRRAVDELKKTGVTEIVAIPLFLSPVDPILRKVIPHLASYASGETIRWAAPMRESYLTAQILLDRVDHLSQAPGQERLVVVGVGAVDEESEKALRADLDRMVVYVRRYRPFKEVQVGIYYDRDAEAGLKEKKNQAADDLVIQTAAKKGLLAATVREDWPEKREKAVAQLKEQIKEAKRQGTVLLISHRLRGAGPYRALLEGVGIKNKEDYEMNGKGFVPHPAITRWLEKGIEREMTAMSGQIAPAAPASVGGETPPIQGAKAHRHKEKIKM